MAKPARHSALAAILRPGAYGAKADTLVVTLAERRPAAMLRLFADANDRNFHSVLREFMGLEPAREPNTAVERDGYTLLWLAPGQWLLVCDEQQAAVSEHALETALTGTTATVADVSHGYSAVQVSGEGTREVLAKRVPVDLDGGVFGPGTCAQTCLAEMNVLLHARAAQTIDVYVGRSYAVSLWEWLTLSAAEFGYRVIETRKT